MSRVLLTVAIDDLGLGPLAAKEAVVMRLEPLGNVSVLRVKEEEEEQLRMAGGAFTPSKPRPEPKPKPKPPAPGGQATASSSRRPQTAMECCYTCACYRSDRNRDAGGKWYWGACGRTGSLVYDIKERCPSWTRLGR